mmetsp:Transcript_8996/g.8363  ORF Transcript_8996/g.8363 Transcript_8996/m.8363 type:complete len:160 (+) Transcript_8996:743-1222(+)
MYAILGHISEGAYSQQNIKYYCDLPLTRETGELELINQKERLSLVIVTDEMFFYLIIEEEGQNKGKPKILYRKSLFKIIKLNVYNDAEINRLSMSQVQEKDVNRFRLLKRLKNHVEERRATNIQRTLSQLDKEIFVMELEGFSYRLRKIKRGWKFIAFE